MAQISSRGYSIHEMAIICEEDQQKTIINCNTEQEKNKEGYIFGYQYVGGIVGFNGVIRKLVKQNDQDDR